MTRPTAADLRGDPRIDWAVTFNLPEATPDPLEQEIDEAWSYVEQVTGRDLDSLSDPDGLEPLAQRAVKYRVIQQAASGYGRFPQVKAQLDGVQSFSTPGYSETRVDPSRGRAGGQQPYRINPWSELDDLLWLLCTPQKQEEWLRTSRGQYEPFVGVAHEDDQLPTFGIERDLW